MASFLDPYNETGSPSVSRNDDNLSNSEGPLLKRNLGQNNPAVSSENVSIARSILARDLAATSYHDNAPRSPFESPKKRYCLWALTFVLAVVGLGNLVLSITIISVLRVSRGMEAMEVIPEESLVKFYGRTDLDRVCVQDGICQGFGDEPIEFTGDDSGVELTVKNRRHDKPRSSFRVLKNGTTFSSVESFEVKDSRTGATFFSTNFPNFGLPRGVRKLAVKLAETNRIVSPVNSSLIFDSNKRINIHGAESTTIESKTIVWVADNDIKVKSNNSIVIKAKKGIFLDISRIPISPIYHSNNAGNEMVGQYKICVCMPEGKIFRIAVPNDPHARVNCARISTLPEHDPCL